MAFGKATRGRILRIVIQEAHESPEKPGMDGIVGRWESRFERVENGTYRCSLRVYNPIQAGSEVLIPDIGRAK